MQKGYSKLLIHEIVLDYAEPETFGMVTDITMMGYHSGKESK